MQKPRLDHIDGLSPAIAIEQKNLGHTPRSTVGTVTEIYDYLRVLYARIGRQTCIKCHKPVGKGDAQSMVTRILEMPEGTKILILAPVIDNRKGEHRDVLDRLQRQGYARVRVNGVVQEIEAVQALARYKKHTIEAVVDRLNLPRLRTIAIEAAEQSGRLSIPEIAPLVAQLTDQGRHLAGCGVDRPQSMVVGVGYVEDSRRVVIGQALGSIKPSV